MKDNINKIVILLSLSAMLIAAVFIALKLRDNSLKDKQYKLDFFTVNQIKYGLLSGTNWSSQVNRIIEQQVDSFNFNTENKKIITQQLDAILYRLFDEADAVLHKKQKKLSDKIKFSVMKTFVDMDKFKAEVPRFYNAIVDEMDKSKNKDQIKKILKEKISGILNATNQDSIGERQQVIQKYSHISIATFNRDILDRTEAIKQEQQKLSYIIVAILVVVLLLWIYIVKAKVLYATSFIFSVFISVATLLVGVSLPMIEVDARIGRLDLELMSSHIVFNDQVIFFQTKSILDVVHILVTNGKIDTVFVGVLIFLFSVLFPVFKLICASLYLFIKNKGNRFINYMAFKSGKWSMADVMVVAIFMSFVGFQGILDDQLSSLETYNNKVMNLVTTNKSSLQPGYLLFVAFVIYNLVLAEVLERITRDQRLEDNKK